MLLFVIIIITIPTVWFLELVNELKTLNEAAELLGTTFFIMIIPTLIAGDLSSWQIPVMGFAAFLGFSMSATMFKFRDF